MTYSELNQHLENLITKLPIFYAFSQPQYKEGCERLGVTNPKEELKSLGYGGFILKSAVPEWDAYVSESKRLREEFFSIHENLVEAFRYELANHEFVITQDPREAWEALGLDIEDSTEFQRKAFIKAQDLYLGSVY